MIQVVEIVKRMRGPSRAVHAVASNGWHYVVKPPMIGRRALINEWIGARLLRMVGVTAPDVVPIRITRSIADAAWPEAMADDDIIGVASAYPVNPSQQGVYDFLPDALLLDVPNLEHFIGALAVDLWAGKTDQRHTVYARQGLMWAHFVDHKNLFGGARWDCSFSKGGSMRNPAASKAYRRLLNEQQIDFWCAQISAIRPEALTKMLASVPDYWLDATTSKQLDALALQLLSRKHLISAMLHEEMVRVARVHASHIPCECCNMNVGVSCP